MNVVCSSLLCENYALHAGSICIHGDGGDDIYPVFKQQYRRHVGGILCCSSVTS